MVPTIKIVRLENSFEGGAIGALLICNKAFCVTLEPADQDNAPNHSCIPASQYLCQRWESRRFGETFKVLNVPKRTDILFHRGNTDDDTTGCIILGITWGNLSGDRAVLNSGKSFESFMDALKDHDEFILTIREVY